MALLATTVVGGGCDTSVTTTVPSDEYHYSIFGILNPAQDTQWVRVEPIAEPTTSGAPRTLDVTVTLENLDTGQEWTLRDSLMRVQRELQHTFWASVAIAPSTSYQLTVRGPEGEITQATTTTPSRSPTVEVEAPIRLPCASFQEANQFGVIIEDVEELAALRVRYFQSVFGPTEVFDYDHYDDITREDDGDYSAVINYFRDLQSAQRTPERDCLADSAKVIVAAGGPDWPDWAHYNDVEFSVLARPDSFTNVEGGHGLLAGVYSDTVRVPIEERVE